MALYREGLDREAEGDTLGLVIRDTTDGQRLVFLAACAEVTPNVERHLRGADLAFFDGTLWRDDEMVTLGLGPKTGQRMGHMSVSGPDGTVAAFRDIPVKRRILIHINNSNPILLDESAERAAVEKEGWEVAYDGMEVSP